VAARAQMGLWQHDIVDSLKLDARPRWSRAVDERPPPRRLPLPGNASTPATHCSPRPPHHQPVVGFKVRKPEPNDARSVADEEDQFDRARSCSSPSVVSPSGPLP
jgi:hypothetical protein